MNQSNYDVIVVGARCAGATLAIYLVRAGLSVLMIDQDKLPSDQVLSTHTIHPPGIDILDEVGVGAAVREVCPASHIVRLSKNGAAVDLRYPDNRAEYCPRRKRLDELLQNAAKEAGAELIDSTRVVGLVVENGRVQGVRVKSKEKEQVFRAKLTVGADGRNSTVAKLVEAEEYYGYDAPRAMYWAYWDTPDFWNTEPEYQFGMYVGHSNGDIRLIFQTDNDQLLIGSLPPVEKVKVWQSDPLAALKTDLSKDPLTGPLIEGLEPDGKVRGTVKERYFFRQGSGSGWALVGDAGHHKEFVIGDGITEALIQAKSLAQAIQKESDEALVHWWRARDVEAIPLFFFGQDEGALPPPPELQSVVFTQVAKTPNLVKQMALVMEHKISPYAAFPVPKILQWTLTAALRGHIGVIPQFFKMGKRASMVQKELEGRKKLLKETMQHRNA